MSQETIGQVLGRTPSGLFILTASDGRDRETGLLVSWVQQASFEPPMVSVAVRRDRYLHDWLQQSPQVALNLLGESQAGFLKHFARGFEPGQSAFEGLTIRRGATGVPVLATALGTLEGRIVGKMDAGDHVLYLVEVSHAATGSAFDERPMVHVRKNGFRY